MPRLHAVAAGATSLVLALSAAGTAPAATSPSYVQDRQRAFTAAAAEFGVPVDVLLGVSYLESEWNGNSGAPSVAAGYGPMHLTDFATASRGGTEFDEGPGDPRGDESRRALHPAAPPPQVPAAQLQTLTRAAALLGIDPARLRSDPAQNIRGGAALLADHQRQLGLTGQGSAGWYGAVARYSGATDSGAAGDFATEVFSTIQQGADRVTDDGQHVALAAEPGLKPDTAQLDRLGLARPTSNGVECPHGLSCESVPAPYTQFGPTAEDYGNHDTADRPAAGKVDYIVIHDTEASWDTTLKLINDPKYVSWNYTIRSNDGHVAQHVLGKDVAWHAGNWYFNAKSVGIEHEGFLAQGGWYTEAMYRSSAKLVRYLAQRYQIPLDRQHILGHDNVPGTTPSTVAGMHTDPGPHWDWAHYFALIGAPLFPTGLPFTGMVTIKPDFAENKLVFTGCTAKGVPCDPRSSTSVILHSQPSDDSPLLTDIGLHPGGEPQTLDVNDVGSRAETGQQYAVAERRGDWTAIWYLGQKGWFHSGDALWATGFVVTPKDGRASVPVYGRAYPEAAAYPPGQTPQAIVPLQYSLPAGQRYVYGGQAAAEYLPTVWDPSGTKNTPVRGRTRYYEIQFGHRVAFVNADDVQLVPSFV
ncbi:peptidoglycan recognition family protein [Kutzneria viridogrisea]|uniref:N-acetylmuramoyl-L-alanine amidase n=1 Tax=Kutzneria viridogrisea TaxID=47990 RepID=A0ABR6BG58_9PSEU|nr:hypothetical protein [Kutzneria viridogrisea]